MATTLPFNMEAPVILAPLDGDNNPAAVENVAYTLSSAAAQVFPAADGMSAIVVPITPGETVQLTVTADARIGEGVVELTGMVEFTLIGAEAVNLGLSVGALQPKTAH